MTCRHFLGIHPANRPSCRMGRDVRAWAIRCNKGDSFGIGLRLPCKAKSQGKPLFDCPELDRKTDDEVENEKNEMSDSLDAVIAALPKLNAMKKKMIVNGIQSAVATCPWCRVKDALSVRIALGANNHMHANCSACGGGFME